MAHMQVILMERVDNLGNLGDVVAVKPGYARNFLLPQNKALRATPDNIAYFEARKKDIEKDNEARRKDSEKEAAKIKNLMVEIIRHASESGQLYGSVTARDIAETISGTGALKIGRSMIALNDALKTIGVFDVTVALHPEVHVAVKVNIARTADEAKVQAKTGKALIVGEDTTTAEVIAEAEAKMAEESSKAKEAMLEESALETEKRRAEEEAERQVEEAERTAKAAAKAEAKAAAKAAEEEASVEADEDTQEESKD